MRTSQVSGMNRIDNRLLRRLVILLVITAILIAAIFGTYYYVDRYIHFGDNSPVELKIKELEKVVVVNPGDLEARLTIAQLYYENGEYSKAIQQAEPVLKANPDDPAPLFLLGVIYSESGQIDTAIASLRHLVDIRRESPMAHVDQVLEASLYYLGVNYLKLNQVDEALKVLSEASEIDGTDADVLYQLGIAHSLKGNDEQAVEAYQNAVRFVPNFTEAYQGMADAYRALSMTSEALYAQGMTFFSTKDYEQARQYLERAAQDLPAFVPVYLGLALAYEQQGDIARARMNIEHVLELEPDNFNANVILGRLGSANSVS